MNRAHRIADQVRSVVGWLHRLPTESQFVSKGYLSPAEFVDAGDQLTFQSPTWHWQSCDSRKQVFWLPADKQYLITRNIPCRHRLVDWDRNLLQKSHVNAEGWLVPGAADGSENEIRPNTQDSNADGHMQMLEGKLLQVKNFDSDGSDDEEFEQTKAKDYIDCGDKGYMSENTVVSRTYDLSITYDKYYQSPRLWLFGYDETGVPLVAESVFEDIHNDYLAKTVTVDPHPFTGVPTVSIHPCKHAQIMRSVAQNWIKNGVKPRHDLALFILLKMVSSVVPTINYDFTIDIEMPLNLLNEN